MIISVKEIKKFIANVLIAVLVGTLSSVLSVFIAGEPFKEIYSSLMKPNFAPPGSIFKIIWPILYILMGISYYIVSKSQKSSKKINDAKYIYYIQLGLNFLWSILFFGFGLRFVALVDLFLLILFIVVMIYKFFIINTTAGLINIPYLIWLFYALVLNYFVWILNQ